MSTIQKCCEIAKELSEVFGDIKAVNPSPFEKDKSMNTICEQDKKNILKLFNYDKWSSYMKWVDQKLQQSGQDLQTFLQASGVESVEPTDTVKLSESEDVLTTKKQAKFHDQSYLTQSENEFGLLQKENKKLWNQNLLLNKKYEELKKTYAKIMK